MGRRGLTLWRMRTDILPVHARRGLIRSTGTPDFGTDAARGPSPRMRLLRAVWPGYDASSTTGSVSGTFHVTTQCSVSYYRNSFAHAHLHNAIHRATGFPRRCRVFKDIGLRSLVQLERPTLLKGFASAAIFLGDRISCDIDHHLGRGGWFVAPPVTGKPSLPWRFKWQCALVSHPITVRVQTKV